MEVTADKVRQWTRQNQAAVDRVSQGAHQMAKLFDLPFQDDPLFDDWDRVACLGVLQYLMHEGPDEYSLVAIMCFNAALRNTDVDVYECCAQVINQLTKRNLIKLHKVAELLRDIDNTQAEMN